MRPSESAPVISATPYDPYSTSSQLAIIKASVGYTYLLKRSTWLINGPPRLAPSRYKSCDCSKSNNYFVWLYSAFDTYSVSLTIQTGCALVPIKLFSTPYRTPNVEDQAILTSRLWGSNSLDESDKYQWTVHERVRRDYPIYTKLQYELQFPQSQIT